MMIIRQIQYYCGYAEANKLLTVTACLFSFTCHGPLIFSIKYRPISQTVFMLSIAINRAKHVCATVIIKHNYMLMCNHKIVINIMLCL